MTLGIQQLSFERDYRYVFRNVCFEVNAGEALLIRGANGCGKSTLLRILAGLLEPTSGEIQFKKNNIHHHLTDYQAQVNYLGHQNGIKLKLTTRENLILHAALSSAKRNTAEITAIAEQMQLTELLDKSATHLSAGQARRLSLAKLMLSQANVWILDEPTTALDAQSQTLFGELLNKHLASGGMAILSSHHALDAGLTNKTIQLSDFHA